MPSIVDNDESALIHACIAQESGAWASFVRRYGRLIRVTAADLRSRNRAYSCDVDDLAAYVYERLLDDSCRRLRRWEGRSKFSTYLVHVTLNLCRDYIAKHGEERRVERWRELPDWLRASVPPACELDRQEQIEAMLRAIKSLSPRQAMVIRLRSEGRSLREISQIMHIPEGTAFSLSTRAIACLRTRLADHSFGEHK